VAEQHLGAVPRHADHGREADGVRGADEVVAIRDAEALVLGVEEHPVEAAQPGELDEARLGEVEEGADGQLTAVEPCPEAVLSHSNSQPSSSSRCRATSSPKTRPASTSA